MPLSLAGWLWVSADSCSRQFKLQDMSSLAKWTDVWTDIPVIGTVLPTHEGRKNCFRLLSFFVSSFYGKDAKLKSD